MKLKNFLKIYTLAITNSNILMHRYSDILGENILAMVLMDKLTKHSEKRDFKKCAEYIYLWNKENIGILPKPVLDKANEIGLILDSSKSVGYPTGTGMYEYFYY